MGLEGIAPEILWAMADEMMKLAGLAGRSGVGAPNSAEIKATNSKGPSLQEATAGVSPHHIPYQTAPNPFAKSVEKLPDGKPMPTTNPQTSDPPAQPAVHQKAISANVSGGVATAQAKGVRVAAGSKATPASPTPMASPVPPPGSGPKG